MPEPAPPVTREYLDRHFREDDSWRDAAGVRGADAATYRVLNHAWSVDDRRVYLHGKQVKAADRASFQVLNEMFARDATRVYCKWGKTTAILDAANFGVLDAGVDIDSFGALRYLSHARSGESIYYAEYMGHGPREIRGADASTFVVLGDRYARDAKKLYYQGKAIGGTTAQGFQQLNRHYARTDKVVLYYGRKIAGANPKEFEVLSEFRARDSKQVYDHGMPEQPPLARVGGVDLRYKKQRQSRSELSFLDKVVIVALIIPALIFALFEWLYEVITGRRGTKEERKARKDASNDDAVRELATVLARGDSKALKLVLEALDDPDGFRDAHADDEGGADSPDLASLISEAEDDEDFAWHVMLEVFESSGIFGTIDWKGDTDSTIDEIDPMLHSLGVRDFDWSFIDVLAEHGNGDELRNENFLSVLRDRLATRGLALAQVQPWQDAYTLTVMRTEDFEKVKCLDFNDQSALIQEFGANEGYESAKKILAQRS